MLSVSNIVDGRAAVGTSSGRVQLLRLYRTHHERYASSAVSGNTAFSARPSPLTHESQGESHWAVLQHCTSVERTFNLEQRETHRTPPRASGHGVADGTAGITGELQGVQWLPGTEPVHPRGTHIVYYSTAATEQRGSGVESTASYIPPSGYPRPAGPSRPAADARCSAEQAVRRAYHNVVHAMDTRSGQLVS